jgi:5'-nucleotidase
MDGPPDVVVSGINHGANRGTDVLYSGTVSAAMEGAIEGIPALAVSLTSFTQRRFEPAAQFIRSLLASQDWFLPQALLLNINVPPLASADIKGVKLTQQGVRRYFDQFEKRLDPRGKTYYWLAGEVVEDMEDPNAHQAVARSAQANPDRYSHRCSGDSPGLYFDYTPTVQPDGGYPPV